MILANINLNTNEHVVYMRPIRLERETRYTILAKWHIQSYTLPLRNNNSTSKDCWPSERTKFSCRDCLIITQSRCGPNDTLVTMPKAPESDTPSSYQGPEKYHVKFNFNFANLPLTCSTSCRFKGGNRGVLDKFCYIKL